MAAKATENAAVVFDKAALINSSKELFNQSPDVVTGALYNVNGELSIEEATKKINNFLERPIKNED